MAQGRSKAKAQLPPNVKAKKKFCTKSKVICSRRPNAPVPRKLATKNAETIRMQKEISKGVTETLETELRSKALNGKKSLLSKKELQDKEDAKN